ncbi:hypothetical protein WME76_17885 [Sorangium sp. So ce119]|uniref:hypothetical protein n=1 Tax=Sorangium sp. So ce119 TaxID=3133279 RepID=UPI003F632701
MRPTELGAGASPLGLLTEQSEPATGAAVGSFPPAFSHVGRIASDVRLAGGRRRSLTSSRAGFISTTANVNVGIAPDSGATVACLLLALSPTGGPGLGAPAPVVHPLESLLARQR